MQLKGKRAEAFLAAPDPAVRAVLVFGPDDGLVRERAAALVRAVAQDPGDPFRVAEIAPEDVAKDPPRLFDEAAAIAMTGGRRAVRLRGAGDGLSEILSGFLEAAPGDSLLVVEAGDLPPRSRLRRLFEGAEAAAALPCYRDEGRELDTLIGDVLGEAGHRASREARDYLAANLGGDRMVTRRELEKLVLYMGGNGGGEEVTLADAQACIGDSAALSLEDVAFAVGDGDLAGLERALTRAFQEGVAWVSPLRAAARHLERLHRVVGAAAQGVSAADAMARLRPPVFWKLRDRFARQAAAWTVPRLSAALTRLTQAEIEGKAGNVPGEVLSARTLLAIAAQAPQARGR